MSRGMSPAVRHPALLALVYCHGQEDRQKDDAEVFPRCCGPRAALLQRLQHINQVLQPASVPAQ